VVINCREEEKNALTPIHKKTRFHNERAGHMASNGLHGLREYAGKLRGGSNGITGTNEGSRGNLFNLSF